MVDQVYGKFDAILALTYGIGDTNADDIGSYSDVWVKASLDFIIGRYGIGSDVSMLLVSMQ
ncbi:26S proteasome non-ATPase regulatory subunit 2, partial [Manis javanica]